MSNFPPADLESRLPRPLSISQMSMVGFGAVISFGLVSGTVFPLYLAGPASVLAYLAAAIVLVLLVRCMAALSVAGPVSGSFSEGISRQLGCWAAGFTRGAYFLVVTAIVGTEIAFLPPALRPWTAGLPDWLIGLAGLLLPALVIGHGARTFARVEATLSVIKIGAVMGLLAVSVRMIGSVDDASALGASWFRGLSQADSGALWTSFVLATLGFVGIESLSLAARETSAAPAVLRARMVAVGRSLALLVWVLVAVASALLHTGVPPLRLPLAQYLLTLVSQPRAHLLFGALIAVTVLSVVNSQLYGASRTLYEAARAGDLPGCLGRLRAGSPRAATLAAFLCSTAVFLMVVYDRQNAFKIATAIATMGALAVWSMIFMAALRLASSDAAGARPRFLKRWQAFLGLSVTLVIAVSLPFMDFFGAALWAGAPALLAVGAGMIVLDIYRRRKIIASA